MNRRHSLGLALAVCLLPWGAKALAQYVVDQERFRQNTEPFQQKQYDVDQIMRNVEKAREKSDRRAAEPAAKIHVNVEEATTWAVILGLAGVAVFLGLKAVGHALNQSSVSTKPAAREQALNDPWVQGRLAQLKAAGPEGAAVPPGPAAK